MPTSQPAAADCFVRLGVELISHRWDAVVLTALRAGPARRVDLIASIGGISDKSLHQSLVRLRDRQLVRRGDASTYALTDVGSSLATGSLLDLARWAEQHQLSVRTDG
ncbi:winged helix-turn-helix transcriptional regulator [Gordonia sputi]|uniref:winged helix-turn-helix transcriptional regulator n=1 Tax=Gordonia sputi TaxID=36823 RepID=UPI0020448BD0|nr:winged helix-turn-helix transcriptional regulator [Gordonia sputi]MCM3894003.1 winged helix-turn-helix transcriptional regulator [Gordonia sputi]